MGNLSYCRFQNTLQDLQDCHRHLGDDDLSRAEEQARRELIERCKRIVADAEAYGIHEVEC